MAFMARVNPCPSFSDFFRSLFSRCGTLFAIDQGENMPLSADNEPLRAVPQGLKSPAKALTSYSILWHG
jgi:hypothetical protein